MVGFRRLGQCLCLLFCVGLTPLPAASKDVEKIDHLADAKPLAAVCLSFLRTGKIDAALLQKNGYSPTNAKGTKYRKRVLGEGLASRSIIGTKTASSSIHIEFDLDTRKRGSEGSECLVTSYGADQAPVGTEYGVEYKMLERYMSAAKKKGFKQATVQDRNRRIKLLVKDDQRVRVRNSVTHIGPGFRTVRFYFIEWLR